MLSIYFSSRDLSACPIREGAFPSASAAGKPPLPGTNQRARPEGSTTKQQLAERGARNNFQAKETWQELQMLRRAERAGKE